MVKFGSQFLWGTCAMLMHGLQCWAIIFYAAPGLGVWAIFWTVPALFGIALTAIGCHVAFCEGMDKGREIWSRPYARSS